MMDGDYGFDDEYLGLSEGRMLEAFALNKFRLSYDEYLNPDEPEWRMVDFEENAWGIYEDVKHHFLVQNGFVFVEYPEYCSWNGRWQIIDGLTGLGRRAYSYVSRDIWWNMSRRKPDFSVSLTYWSDYLESAYFPGEEAFTRVRNLRDPMFDALRERIPETRRKMWERELIRSKDNPKLRFWDRLATTTYPELESLKLGMTEHLVEAWIKQVEKITTPDDPLFAEVMALGDEYNLVKNVAFQQKLMVWTPVDNEGKRQALTPW